jgi:hypothetical protein
MVFVPMSADQKVGPRNLGQDRGWKGARLAENIIHYVREVRVHVKLRPAVLK